MKKKRLSRKKIRKLRLLFFTNLMISIAFISIIIAIYKFRLSTFISFDVNNKSSNSESEKIEIIDNKSKQSNSLEVLPEAKTYLNHFPYSEIKKQKLIKVADFYGREEFLASEAAIAFNQMKLDSRKNGVELVLISGFRSITDQDKLFQKQINKQGNKKLAAKLSAPPGYSEHHTGYGVDIGQGEDIDTYTKYEFDRTEAFLWLTQNAHKYGFELSFPKDNLQGVSYEPWHWRYINPPTASSIFANARN